MNNINWKTNATELSKKMLLYIDKEVTYTQLEARAVSKGINLHILDQALTILHKVKSVNKRVKAGDIVYSPSKVKKFTFGSHLTWVRNNYPPMNDSNNGSGIEMDFSYLFLTPEELEKYKAEVTGRAYVPSKRYVNTR